MPLSTLEMACPYEKLFKMTPDYAGIKVIRCKCFPYLRNYNKTKFDGKTFPCVFIGYSSLHKGYRCLNPMTKRVYISRHVIFYETIFLFSNKNKFVECMQEPSQLTTFPFYNEWLNCPNSVKTHDVVNPALSQKPHPSFQEDLMTPTQMQTPLSNYDSHAIRTLATLQE